MLTKQKRNYKFFNLGLNTSSSVLKNIKVGDTIYYSDLNFGKSYVEKNFNITATGLIKEIDLLEGRVLIKWDNRYASVVNPEFYYLGNLCATYYKKGI